MLSECAETEEHSSRGGLFQWIPFADGEGNFSEAFGAEEAGDLVPCVGLDGKIEPETLAALEETRKLILEVKNCDGNLAAAEERNRFVWEQADIRWLPYVSPGGMLDRLVKEMGVREKVL